MIEHAVFLHVRDSLYGENGRVETAKYDPLGRLVGVSTKVGTILG